MGLKMPRRRERKAPSVRKGIAPRLPGQPNGWKHCTIWGCGISPSFCKECYAKEHKAATRAECVKECCIEN